MAEDASSRDSPQPGWLHLANANDPYAGTDVKVVVTFEGGGAKGLCHLGALRGLESTAASTARTSKFPWSPIYQVKGYAGTSIGALVAALAAVGYTAEEMLGTNSTGANSSQIPESLALRNAGFDQLMDAFGFFGRFRFAIARWILGRNIGFLCLLSFFWTLIAIFITISLLYVSKTAGMSIDGPPFVRKFLIESILNKTIWDVCFEVSAYLLSLWIISLLAFLVTLRIAAAGLCNTKTLAKGIDLDLLAKINPAQHQTALAEERKRATIKNKILSISGWGIKPHEIGVRFCEIGTNTPLCVVATSLSNQSIQLFSSGSTPRIYIAEAVAASMALPVIFRPAKVRSMQGRFADGGFTSNLPSWSFDVTRGLDPDLFTIGIEIKGDKFSVPKNVTKSFQNIQNLIQATIFGARQLETRLTRHVSIPIETEIELLQFDHKTRRISSVQCIASAEFHFRATMLYRALVRQEMAQICHDVCSIVADCLESDPRKPLADDDEPWIRVRLLTPSGHGALAYRTIWTYVSTSGSARFSTDDGVLWPIARPTGTRAAGAVSVSSLPGLAAIEDSAYISHPSVDGEFDADQLIWDDAPAVDTQGDGLRYVRRLLLESSLAIVVPSPIRVPAPAPGFDVEVRSEDGSGRRSNGSHENSVREAPEPRLPRCVAFIDANINPASFSAIAGGAGAKWDEMVRRVQATISRFDEVKRSARDEAQKVRDRRVATPLSHDQGLIER